MTEKKFYSITAIALWILASFGMWEVVYELCHIVGAIASLDSGYALYEVGRMLPMMLTAIAYLTAGILLHKAYVAESDEIRVQKWRGMGIFLIAIGVLIIIYIVFGLCKGTYLGLTEGNPTPLFPLDLMIGGFLFAGAGCLILKRTKSGEKKSDADLSQGSAAPRIFRGILGEIGGFFCVLTYLIATSSFAAFLMGIFIMDWKHGAVFYNIMLLLVYGLAFGYFAVYRFIYCELPKEKKASELTKIGLGSLILALVVMVAYMVALEVYPDASTQNAMGLLPVDYISNMSLLPFIYGANNLLVPICALIYGWSKKFLRLQD